MLQATRVFRPITAGTATIAVTTSSAATALPAQTTHYRLYNAGAGTVFFDFGASGGSTLVASGTPVAPGNTEVFATPPGVTHILTIGSANATLYVTAGEGA